jgi:mono/diheme cytochrome c family protein
VLAGQGDVSADPGSSVLAHIFLIAGGGYRNFGGKPTFAEMRKIMLKKTLFTLFAFAVVNCTLFASDTNLTIQAKKISPTDGKGMYSNYCAPCHGVNGKGNGPFASSLKRTPPDLSLLSRKNNGVFPEKHVIGVIGRGTSASGHDRAGMPDWAQTLDKIDQTNKMDTPLRISNLSKYVGTLQSK